MPTCCTSRGDNTSLGADPCLLYKPSGRVMKLLNDAMCSNANVGCDQDHDCSADLIGDPLSVLKSTVGHVTKSVERCSVLKCKW